MSHLGNICLRSSLEQKRKKTCIYNMFPSVSRCDRFFFFAKCVIHFTHAKTVNHDMRIFAMRGDGEWYWNVARSYIQNVLSYLAAHISSEWWWDTVSLLISGATRRLLMLTRTDSPVALSSLRTNRIISSDILLIPFFFFSSSPFPGIMNKNNHCLLNEISTPLPSADDYLV